MQKFHRPEPAARYEDVLMVPGHTHEPFYRGAPPVYPWHQYHADTDCLWLAIESSEPSQGET